MNVAELWEKYEGQKIRVGTENGSAFIWIGEVGEDFLSDMGYLFKTYSSYFDFSLHRAKKKLSEMIPFEKIWQELPMAYAYNLDELKRAKKKLEWAKEAKKACTNLLQREVVAEYKSIEQEDVTIVIIKGYETGRAWCEDEWDGLFSFNARKARIR